MQVLKQRYKMLNLALKKKKKKRYSSGQNYCLPPMNICIFSKEMWIFASTYWIYHKQLILYLVLNIWRKKVRERHPLNLEELEAIAKEE